MAPQNEDNWQETSCPKISWNLSTKIAYLRIRNDKLKYYRHEVSKRNNKMPWCLDRTEFTLLTGLSVHMDHRWKQRQQGQTLAENETCNTHFISTISTTKCHTVLKQAYTSLLNVTQCRPTTGSRQCLYRVKLLMYRTEESNQRKAIFTLYAYRHVTMQVHQSPRFLTKIHTNWFWCVLSLSYNKISVTLDPQFNLYLHFQTTRWKLCSIIFISSPINQVRGTMSKLWLTWDKLLPVRLQLHLKHHTSF